MQIRPFSASPQKTKTMKAASFSGKTFMVKSIILKIVLDKHPL